MAVVTEDDLREFANINASDAGAGDGELQDCIDTAIRMVEDRCGPLEPRHVSEYVTTDPGGVAVLRYFPVVEVTAPVTVDATFSDYSAGVVALGVAGRVQVTYTAGRDQVPAPLRTAVLHIAGHLWEMQRSPVASGSPLQDYGATATGVGIVSRGYALPRRAAEAMAPYLLPALP